MSSSTSAVSPPTPGRRDEADVPAGDRSAARRGAWLVCSAFAALVVGAGGFAVAAANRADPAIVPLGPGDVTIELRVEHSLFEPAEITVVEGTRLRFVVDNTDPINHELIVGGPDVHARHAQGTEAEHPSIPGEVSVGPNELGVTTLRFDEPGRFEFACHLPGHYEYGMHGVVEVVPARDA
jgi:uncharacterized cupredoxin-like copper-binding protein